MVAFTNNSTGFVLVMIASFAVFMSVRDWHVTVTDRWKVPASTAPGLAVDRMPETKSDHDQESVSTEVRQSLAKFADALSFVGTDELNKALQVESAFKQAARVKRHGAGPRDAQTADGSSENVQPNDDRHFPASIASLFVSLPRVADMDRINGMRAHPIPFDVMDTIRLTTSALIDLAEVVPRIVDKESGNITFARNTVDKLKYQLDNFAPLNHAFAPKQWNPDRVVDMGLHTAHHPHKYFIIGISTVHRRENYLLLTLTSFIDAMSERERTQVRFVIFNADVPPSLHSDIPRVKSKYAQEIERGMITIIERPDGDLPHSAMADLSKLTLRWGDDLARVKWRSKQVLDVAYLMEQVYENHMNFGYFLMMEDDIIANKGFPTKIRQWVDSALYARTDWTMASFYNPWQDVNDGDRLEPYKFFGVIGQLFRMHDLPVVVEFLRRNFDQSPLDWLFVDFLKKFDGHLIQHCPSQFQHQGKVSSFEGKIQDGRSVDFEGAQPE